MRGKCEEACAFGMKRGVCVYVCVLVCGFFCLIYPNIILSHRVQAFLCIASCIILRRSLPTPPSPPLQQCPFLCRQPGAIVNKEMCASCDFNQESNNCKRALTWKWRCVRTYQKCYVRFIIRVWSKPFKLPDFAAATTRRLHFCTHVSYTSRHLENVYEILQPGILFSMWRWRPPQRTSIEGALFFHMSFYYFFCYCYNCLPSLEPVLTTDGAFCFPCRLYTYTTVKTTVKTRDVLYQYCLWRT